MNKANSQSIRLLRLPRREPLDHSEFYIKIHIEFLRCFFITVSSPTLYRNYKNLLKKFNMSSS